MRWSWPAFGAGLAVGVVVCVLLFAGAEPEPSPEAPRAMPPAAVPRTETAAAARTEPRPARRRATEGRATSAAEPTPAPRESRPSQRKVEVPLTTAGAWHVAAVEHMVGDGWKFEIKAADFSPDPQPFRFASSPVNAPTSQSLADRKSVV